MEVDTSKKAAKPQSIKTLIASAKAFATRKNGGLTARTRAKLNEMKPGITILVQERLSILDIQEFVREQTGLKIALPLLRQYCRDHFDYPPTKNARAPAEANGVKD